MILIDRYHQIMDEIQLSPESRQRILHNISQPKKQLHFPARWVSLAAAACLLLIVGLSFVSPLHHDPQPPQRPNRVVGSAGIESAVSLEELSALVGFPVKDMTGLIPQAERMEYLAFHKSLAQVSGIGAEETVIFRQATGSEDCSGDSTPYPALETIAVNDLTVTLKGTEEQSFLLALWTDGSFTYAVKMTQPRTAQQWQQLLEDAEK